MADSLKRNREAFNARFAMAQRSGARIDREAFMTHLSSLVDPIIRAIACQFSEKVDIATTDLYELSLELFAENVLGNQSREAAIQEGWRTLLPAVPRLLARDPRRVAASVTNAIHQIGQNEGARPHEWIANMSAIGNMCDDLHRFFEAGRIAAWIAGCPQYRPEAIRIARLLPAPIVASLFGFSDQIPTSNIHSAIDAITANRWLSAPEAVSGAKPLQLRIVRLAGAFRGFGGAFLRPPTTWTSGTQLMATDGEVSWFLHTDVYGCIFRRSQEPAPPPSRLNGPVKLSNYGELSWYNESVKLPSLVGWTSVAFDGQTLAVTLPSSHHVFLVARG